MVVYPGPTQEHMEQWLNLHNMENMTHFQGANNYIQRNQDINYHHYTPAQEIPYKVEY